MRKNVRNGLALATMMLLAGCVSAEQRAAAAANQQRIDQAECQRLGFKPGTDAIGDCVLRLREIRAQEHNTEALRQANTPSPWGPWGPYGPYRRW